MKNYFVIYILIYFLLCSLACNAQNNSIPNIKYENISYMISNKYINQNNPIFINASYSRNPSFGIYCSLGSDSKVFLFGAGIRLRSFFSKYIGFSLCGEGFLCPKDNDIIDDDIPHNDYHTTDFKTENYFDFETGLVFSNINHTFLVDVRAGVYIESKYNINVSNVTGWKWKGNSYSQSYPGGSIGLYLKPKILELGMQFKFFNSKIMPLLNVGISM